MRAERDRVTYCKKEDALRLTEDREKVDREGRLVRDAINGDQAAMEALFVRYQQRLYKATLRICGNPEDAEDALQDGLLMAFRHLHGFQGRSLFSTWLTRIVINAALMRVRRRRCREMISIDQADPVRGELA